MAKLMPAREQAKPVRIIHDLDIIDSEQVGFKLNGKNYCIEDLKVGQGMKISLAYSKLIDLEMKLSQGETIDQNDLLKGYYDVMSVVIPDIKMDEIHEMGQSRVNLILSLIARKLTGDPSLAEEIEKKKLQDQKKSSESNISQKLHSFVSSISGRIKTF